MQLTETKRKALVADLLLVMSVLLAALAPVDRGGWSLLFLLQFPLVFGACWLFLARLKCPHCGARLSRDFPLGALTMLPLGKQSCKRCEKSL